MSYCLNPHCLNPDDPLNGEADHCRHCGSSLLLGDRYRVLHLLSDHSGFAKIFDVSDGEMVKILKVLKSQHNANEKVVSLFKQEAVVLSQLNHPGIPRIDPEGYFDYWPRDSRYPVHCFVMEKIDGPNLQQWMHQQGNLLISEAQALDWLEQLTTILHLVHRKNYFHRDIKLQNIMVRSTGQLVLIDFGTAREMTYTYLAKAGSSGNITRVSSAGYTPPEQQQGHAVPQSDFFALGRTFVYLLTGRTLEDQAIYDPLTNEFHWRQHAPDLSPGFADLLDQLMAYRAGDRPRDNEAILQAIGELKRSPRPLNSITTPPSPIEPLQNLTRLPETALQISPDSPTVPQESPQQRRWPLGLGIALLVAFGSYGGWQAYQTVWPSSITYAAPEQWAGHTSFINDLAISPDSQYLITGSADRTLKIWDLNSGDLRHTLEGHGSFINAVEITPDGQFVITGSADRTIKVWRVEDGHLERTLSGHQGFVDQLHLSPDGQTLVSTGADHTVRIWDWQRGQLRHTLTGHTGFINGLAISNNGEILITASADQTVRFWTMATGRESQLLRGHTNFVNAVVVSPDDRWVASGSADQTIQIWDLQTGEQLQTLRGHEGFINDLAVSPDGRWLVSASADQTVRIWDMTTGTLARTLRGHGNYVNRVQITQNGQTIITASADRTVRLWSLTTGEAIASLTGHNAHINDFVLSPDERWVVTGSGAKDVALWLIEI
ncbi:protein kinase [Spirulina sp. CCNP1310]|uniref:protein kinase domain-containing protein n=1 Tax=Spirulina sp. CCNP1310 TaxID=3110249 RepID=UPI002B207024|nr:protein kinase [Spirulina sp. CCNP1310]MEA5420041.1 protein kinase [Spirulina sp. CCNP1310]